MTASKNVLRLRALEPARSFAFIRETIVDIFCAYYIRSDPIRLDPIRWVGIPIIAREGRTTGFGLGVRVKIKI